MRRIYPLVLVVLAAGPSSPRAADGDAADKVIRDLAERYYAAYAAKDLDAFMALWSETSPDYDAHKKTMTGLLAETGPIVVKSLAVVRARRDGDAASVRVRVELAGNDAKTGKPHPFLGRLDCVLDLAREGGAWKVMHYGPSGVRMLERLVAANSKAERLRLLDDDSDLIGSEFVAMVLDEGDAQARRGWLDQASGLQDVAFEVAEGMGDRDSLAMCHLNRGLVLDLRLRYEPAVASFQKALALFHEANDQEGEGKVLGNIGLLYEDTGRYPEALQQFQDGLQIERGLKDRAGEAAFLYNIGLLHEDTGRYTEALQQFHDGLTITCELGDRAGEAKTLNGIGLVYADMGQYAEALKQYQYSLKIARDQDDWGGEAATLNNIGLVYQVTGRYAEALQQYQDSLTIARALGDREGKAATLNNIGLVYENTGRYTEALQQFQDSLKIERDLKDRAGEAITLGNIGDHYTRTGRYGAALEQYQASLEIKRDVKDRAGEAQTLNDMGVVYYTTKRFADARQQFEAALGVAESIGSLDTAVSCHTNLGFTYEAQGQWCEAVQAYREAVRVTELLRINTREPSLQTSLLAQKIDPFFRLSECLLELGQSADAFAAGERMKARGLVDILQQGKADIRRGMSAEERKEEQTLLGRLTALGVQLDDPKGKTDGHKRKRLMESLDRVRRDLDAFHRDLYLNRPDLATRRAEFAPSSLDDLGGALFAGRPGLVVLSYLIGDKETLLFVLTAAEKSGSQARLTIHRIDQGSKDLAEAVGAFRAACADPAAAAPNPEELYRWLVAPAADELANAKQVVIVPDGVLHTLPFQSLRPDSEDKYLIERFPISYAPSVTALVKMEELGAARRKKYAGKPATLLAVGLSDFRGRQEESRPLAAAEPEARAMAGLFGAGGRTLLADDATRANLEAAWGACRYLHFATHGRLNPDAPLYSALLLSTAGGDEGVLYARDLLDADVPAELAVMSACETGLGARVSGEGMLGLSWSWFAAGVPSTVASQWSVGDACTARLMKAFYARLAAGDSKAEALRQAELALLADPATRHPFYWAPFVLVGDDK